MHTEMTIWDRLKVLVQYIIPQHFLTSLMFQATRCQWRPWKNLLIRYVIDKYKVDMNIARQQDYRSFASFNEFFTRELKADARPIDVSIDSIVSPVDGTISQLGKIDHSDIFQAKGHSFNLRDLLAGEQALAETFTNGNFATLYLSPRDYHRIHMPVDGQLQKMIYVPGKLFSVNALTTRCVSRLFSRNERLISIFNTGCGNIAVILVGAIFVGSMETVWAGQITPTQQRKIRIWNYQQERITLARGQELGRFNMGSTVILLSEPGKIEWLQGLQAESPVIMGQAIGKIKI